MTHDDLLEALDHAYKYVTYCAEVYEAARDELSEAGVRLGCAKNNLNNLLEAIDEEDM